MLKKITRRISKIKKYFVEIPYLWFYLVSLTFRRSSSLLNHSSHDIIFFCYTPTFAQAKISQELIKNNIVVRIIYVNSPNYSLSNYFSSSIKVKNKYHALLRLPPYKQLHCFSSSIDPIVAFLLKKASNTIYHPTDVLINAKHQNQNYKKLQFDAFLDADKITYRDLTTLDIKNLRPLIKHKKSIFFPEYISEPSTAKKLDGLHIVSTGNLQMGNADNGHELFSFVKFIVNKGIYFHIYPFWGWANRTREDFLNHHQNYKDLAIVNSRLIIHNTISPAQLQSEIAKYNFGILIRPEFDLKYCLVESNYSLNWLSKTTSSRISDYMESGLITITNWNSEKDLCYRIPSRYSQCINYQDILESLDPIHFLKEKIAANTNKNEGYLMSKNINRLINFYFDN